VLALGLAAASAAALALVPAAGPAYAAAGASHVTGVVNTIQRPLAGAQVVVLETGTSATTDSLGRYDVGVLPPGVWSLRVVAVGYVSAAGTVSVGQDGASAPASWLLKPLHPDGAGLTHGLVVPRTFVEGAESPAPVAAPPTAPTLPVVPAAPVVAPAHRLLADSLAALPRPAPVAPLLTLQLTTTEQAARADLPGPLAELLSQMTTADPLTALSLGTSAPGEETWRQWGERLSAWAAGNPGDPRAPLARRGVAYARTRLALAAGPTWTGYQDAKAARAAVDVSRLDTPAGVVETARLAAFLDSLSAQLDSTFVPGSTPPRPVPVSRHHAKRHSKRRAKPH